MEKYEGMGMKESLSFWKQAWQGMPSAGDVASGVKNDVVNWGRGLSDRVSDKITDMSHVYDDSIVIPKGSLTMLGEDFSVLYDSVTEEKTESSDGWSMTELKGQAGYGTEMMSANLSSRSGRRSIATMQPDQRAAFEIALLSKKYASLYVAGSDASNEAVAQDYTDKMVRYRQQCEAGGISWQQVMQYASWELQTQALEYTNDSKSLLNPGASEGERVMSCRAHSMMLQCAPDGWEDSLLPHLSGRISYEETLDTDRRSVSFLGNIGSWFKEKWEAVKDFVTTPWRSLKEKIPDVIDGCDRIIAEGDRIHEENMAVYRETATEVSQKAQDAVSAAKNKAEDLYNKAQDYFGNHESGSDELQQEPEVSQ